MLALLDRGRLRCGRPGCFQRLADLDDQASDPDGSGTWLRSARLRGGGWDRGADGVWKLDAHGKASVRAGKTPAARHPSRGAVEEIDGPVGGWPLAMHQSREFALRRPNAKTIHFRGGGSAALRPGDLIECGKCGSVNEVSEASLAPTPEVAARLREAGLLR